jgi:hypothetical protein
MVTGWPRFSLARQRSRSVKPPVCHQLLSISLELRQQMNNADAKCGRSHAAILLLGYDPQAVDFSDPALPPGMTAEKVYAGVEAALRRMRGRGWQADVCYIRPDETAGPAVERQLASASYSCVIIGAGVRLPPRRLAVFEAVINAVHEAAPAAAIAFNSRPRGQRGCCRTMATAHLGAVSCFGSCGEC